MAAEQAKAEAKDYATMTAAELEKYIAEEDERHRARMKTLRALLRCRQADLGQLK